MVKLIVILLIMFIIFIFVTITCVHTIGHSLKSCSVEVEAEIVDEVRELASTTGTPENMMTRYPVYRYKYNGEVYTVKSILSCVDFKVGQVVKIYVNPESPRELIPSRGNAKIVIGLLCLICAIFTIAFLILLLNFCGYM